MSLCIALQGQPGKPSVRDFVTVDAVPSAQAIGVAELVLPTDSAFTLSSDGFNVAGEMSQNANCKDGSANWMKFGKARFRKDTLLVTIFRLDRQYVHQLQIKIWKGQFLTTYVIKARNGMSEVSVLPTDQVLVLEKINFVQGDEVTGFVNFRGTRWEGKPGGRPWESKRDWIESTYVVRGPFKIAIE